MYGGRNEFLSLSNTKPAMEKYDGKEPEQLFRDIFNRCQKLGISPNEISKLSSFRKLRSKKSFRWKRNSFLFLAIFVLFYALVIPLGAKSFIKLWVRFWLPGDRLKDDMCVFDMPSEMQNFFMPPVDCAICRNLTEVEKVINISQDEFEKRFAYSRVPVIVKDGTKNWTAPEIFSFEFFKQLYLGPDDSDVERECQFFPYKTEFMSLQEALSMSLDRARKPWYIGWSNCDSKIGSILRNHYQRPYFLPPLSESTNVDWIFMGTPGYGAHMHIDHVDNPSWQAQLKGSKLWTLEPVPECYQECKTVEVVVNPGEVIVLDTNRWYHKTLTVGNDLSITIGSEYD